MGLLRKVVEEAAEQLANQAPLAPPDPYRWMKRAIALAILVFGWMFIIWANRFHISAPTIFLCIAFLAIEVAVYNLFRTGTQVVADGEDDDSTWGRPLGAKGELEREKKTLLKAIKEAEFDREMGKLSKVDADEMIGLYRARAIEVIKELDRLGATSVGTVREQIEREVKARLELEQRTKGVAEKAVEKQENFKKKKGKNAKANAKSSDAKSADDSKSGADSKSADSKSTAEAKSTETESGADSKTPDDAKSADAKSADSKSGADSKSADSKSGADSKSTTDAKSAAAAAKADADTDATDDDDDDDDDDGDGDDASANADDPASAAAVTALAAAKAAADGKASDGKVAADSESAPGVDRSATESSKTAAKEAAQ